MPKIERTSKHLLAKCFSLFQQKMMHRKTLWDTFGETNIAKNSKNNKFNQILDLQREKAKKGLEKAANFTKNTKKQ